MVYPFTGGYAYNNSDVDQLTGLAINPQPSYDPETYLPVGAVPPYSGGSWYNRPNMQWQGTDVPNVPDEPQSGPQRAYGGGQQIQPNSYGGYAPQAGYGGMAPLQGRNTLPNYGGRQAGVIRSAGAVNPQQFGGNYGGGYGYDPLGQLANSYQQAQNQAFAANMQRYQQIMGGYQNANNALNSNLNNVQASGQQGVLNLQNNLQQIQGNSQQGVADLTGRLGGVLNTQQQGVDALQAGGQNNLAGYQSRLGTGLNMVQNLGTTQLDAINRRYDQTGASEQQGLINRGLYNTTVAPAIQRGNEYDRSNALNVANQGIAQQQLGVYTGLSGDYLGAQQRFNDTMYGANQNQVVTQGQVASQLYGANQSQIGLQGQQASQMYGANQAQTALMGQIAGQKYSAAQQPLQFAASVNQTGPNYGQLAGLANAYGAGQQSFANAGMLQQQRQRNAYGLGNYAAQRGVY